jgi:hypothetical protein
MGFTAKQYQDQVYANLKEMSQLETELASMSAADPRRPMKERRLALVKAATEQHQRDYTRLTGVPWTTMTLPADVLVAAGKLPPQLFEFEVEPDDPSRPGEINLNGNPQQSGDYADRRLTAVAYGIYLGGYLLYFEGLEKPVFVPESQVDFAQSQAEGVSGRVYSDQSSADAAVAGAGAVNGKPAPVAYYRPAGWTDRDGRPPIVPTKFSPATTPRTVQLMLDAKHRLGVEVAEELTILALGLAGGVLLNLLGQGAGYAYNKLRSKPKTTEPLLPKPKAAAPVNNRAQVRYNNGDFLDSRIVTPGNKVTYEVSEIAATGPKAANVKATHRQMLKSAAAQARQSGQTTFKMVGKQANSNFRSHADNLANQVGVPGSGRTVGGVPPLGDYEVTLDVAKVLSSNVD